VPHADLIQARADLASLRSEVEKVRGLIGMLETPTQLHGRSDTDKVKEYERRIPQATEMLRIILDRALSPEEGE
jgi:hypothetical protein